MSQNPVWGPLLAHQSCPNLPLRLTTRVVVEVDGRCRSLMKTLRSSPLGSRQWEAQKMGGLNGKYYRFLPVQPNDFDFPRIFACRDPRCRDKDCLERRDQVRSSIFNDHPPSFLEVLRMGTDWISLPPLVSVASTCRCVGAVLVSQAMWLSLKLRV